MRGECKTHRSFPPPPPHPLFSCGKYRENSACSYWSTLERCKNRQLLLVDRGGERTGSRLLFVDRRIIEGPYRFSYPESRAYKCQILWKFGSSHWIMSPSVGLTFPVSYTFYLQNNLPFFERDPHMDSPEAIQVKTNFNFYNQRGSYSELLFYPLFLPAVHWKGCWHHVSAN